jgi:hypothetical protein
MNEHMHTKKQELLEILANNLQLTLK